MKNTKYLILTITVFGLQLASQKTSAQISIWSNPAQITLPQPDYQLMIRAAEMQREREQREAQKKEEEEENNFKESNPNWPACNDLIDYVESNGAILTKLNSLDLSQSSWLNSVVQYKIFDKIIVIIEVYRNGNHFSKDKYIFCDISNDDWINFYYGLNDTGLSYGQRLNKYIFNYKCKCN